MLAEAMSNEQIAALGRDLQAARKGHREAAVRLAEARAAVRARELDLWAADRLAERLQGQFLALVDRDPAAA